MKMKVVLYVATAAASLILSLGPLPMRVMMYQGGRLILVRDALH